jgi:hypothetical protein
MPTEMTLYSVEVQLPTGLDEKRPPLRTFHFKTKAERANFVAELEKRPDLGKKTWERGTTTCSVNVALLFLEENARDQ